MTKKKKKKNKNNKSKNSNSVDEYEIFGDFAYIAGYTEGGAPFGVTHEEMQEMLGEESENEDWDNDEEDWPDIDEISEKDLPAIDEKDLPF